MQHLERNCPNIFRLLQSQLEEEDILTLMSLVPNIVGSCEANKRSILLVDGASNSGKTLLTDIFNTLHEKLTGKYLTVIPYDMSFHREYTRGYYIDVPNTDGLPGSVKITIFPDDEENLVEMVKVTFPHVIWNGDKHLRRHCLDEAMKFYESARLYRAATCKTV